MSTNGIERILYTSQRTLAVILAGTTLMIAAPTSSPASPVPRTVEVHVRNLAHYKLSHLRRVDRAVQWQVNHQLRPIWHTPLIRFDAPSTRAQPGNSWLVDVMPTSRVFYGFLDAADGVHLDYSPIYIEIAGLAQTMPMSLILSHEVIEALVDPAGTRMTHGALTEVCDPVEKPGYRINGITVSNFVTPRWFSKAAVGGSFDFERLITNPLTPTAQGYMPGSTMTGVGAPRSFGQIDY